MVNFAFTSGGIWYVSASGSDSNTGKSLGNAKLTIQAAVGVASAGDSILIAPGDYNEQVTIAATLSDLSIINIGGRESANIAPSGSNKTALTIKANGVRLLGIDCEGTGTGAGAVVSGGRFYASYCKFEGDGTSGGKGLVIGPGSAAAVAALTDHKGSDSLVEHCEFGWADKGLVLQASDYGAATQNHFVDCVFHNNAAAAITESTGTGGTASITFRNLEVTRCVFQDAEDGTAATKYLSLNASNSNTGNVQGCMFPVTLTSGKNLVSTKVIWVGNYHTTALSTGQPS